MATTGDHHDPISSRGTAASKQSDSRRKRSSPNDEDKPYECRFCSRKFDNRQGLGGHMLGHKLPEIRVNDKVYVPVCSLKFSNDEERNQEQPRQLVQQKLSSTKSMTRQSAQQNASSAMPQLSQAHIQRSASEGSLRHGIRIGASPSGAASESAYRASGALRSNPHNSSSGTPLEMAIGDHLDMETIRYPWKQSDTRRKRSSPNDEDKPCECRLCPMKFANFHGLNGHMKRHRAEWNEEQEKKASMKRQSAPQNASSALPRAHELSQVQIQRSASEAGSLTRGIRMGASPSGAASAYRGALQSNPYSSSLGPPPSRWNLGSPKPVSVFRAYGSTLNDDTSHITQQPPKQVHNQHDISLQLSSTPTTHRNISLQSQQNQAGEGSNLAVTTNLLSSNRSLDVHQRITHSVSSALSTLQSQQRNVASIDNRARSSTNQLDGLPEMDGKS